MTDSPITTQSSHAAQKHASWQHAESRGVETDVLRRARERSTELGVRPVSEGTASLLTVLAAASGASAAVEVGTGAGVSGLALMAGLSASAVLTTLDPNGDAQRAAREAFGEARLPTQRTRMITGLSRTVLPRLSAGSYELVVLDGDPGSLAFDVAQARRMLRLGGLLVVVDSLHGDRVPRPAVRDAVTVAHRTVDKALREDEAWVSSVVPTGTGVLLAVRR